MARKLNTVVYVDNKPYGPGDVSARIAKKITNPNVWVNDDEDQAPAPASPPAPPADPPSAYADLDLDELTAAIAERNDGRDDDQKIAVHTNDVDTEVLVAALEADDAAHAS